MNFSFPEALATLGPEADFTVANQARPGSDYLFNAFLPERLETTYHISGGSMTVRATMAGLVGMDSPYPAGGLVEVSSFLESTAKIANHVPLPEAALRKLQDILMRMRLAGGNTNEAIALEALNFLNKVIVQPHLDTMEWLRGQCLVNHAIDWTFNKTALEVNYDVPASQRLTARAGADGYGGASSKFWTDQYALRKAVRRLRVQILHPDTLDVIVANEANKLVQVAEQGAIRTFRKLVGPNDQFSSDVRDTVSFVLYDKEGEVLDPADPSKTKKLPMMPVGDILAVGEGGVEGYQVGQGSTVSAEEEAQTAGALGYTHIAPTTEGGSRPGRWAQLFTPEHLPMQLHGRGVTNGLPVLEAIKNVARARTAMS